MFFRETTGRRRSIDRSRATRTAEYRLPAGDADRDSRTADATGTADVPDPTAADATGTADVPDPSAAGATDTAGGRDPSAGDAADAVPAPNTAVAAGDYPGSSAGDAGDDAPDPSAEDAADDYRDTTAAGNTRRRPATSSHTRGYTCGAIYMGGCCVMG